MDKTEGRLGSDLDPEMMLNVCRAGMTLFSIAAIIVLLSTPHIPVDLMVIVSLFLISSFFVRSHARIVGNLISHGFSLFLLFAVSIQRNYQEPLEIQQYAGQYLGFYLSSVTTFMVFGKSKNHLFHSLIPIITLALCLPVGYLFGTSAQQNLPAEATQQVMQVYGYSILVLSFFTYVFNKKSWIDIGLVRSRETLQELEEKRQQLSDLKEKNERNNALIQERERNKIRREVHDGIGQLTFALRMLWNQYMDRYGKNEEAVEIDGHLQTLIRESRLVIYNLSSIFNDRTTLKKGFEDLVRLAQTEGKILLDLKWNGPDIDYGDFRWIHFFRIAQESMNNALKYSNATAINISVDNDSNTSTISLIVKDDGEGFDLENTPMGFGLQGAQERADIINAELKIGSKPGQGTSVSLDLKY